VEKKATKKLYGLIQMICHITGLALKKSPGMFLLFFLFLISAGVCTAGNVFFKPGNQGLDDASDSFLYADSFNSGNDGLTGTSRTYFNPNGSLKADLSQATGISINELRRGFSLQRWLENNARGGARYIEQILSHFGVRSSDARLQRPEYLGGTKTPVVISEVMQTSESQTTPQGNYAGTGTSFGVGRAFKRFFEEHGYIIGIISIMPRSAYQQGVPRHFKKFDKFDFYWPEFAHLGEQEIKNSEIYYDYDSSVLAQKENDKLFGYSPRYAEYRFINSSVHGDMATTLNFWHLGRIFDSRPGLNGDFVTCKSDTQDTGLNRVFAVTDTNSHHLWVQMYVNCKALRPLPKYGTPGL